MALKNLLRNLVKPAAPPQAKNAWLALWNSMRVTGFQSEASAIAGKIHANLARYQGVERATGVPWYVAAVIHHLECDGDFRLHLHNGDPLTARTVHVPRNRPAKGSPPFSWLASAIDAVEFEGWDSYTNWPLEKVLERLERYNGGGYIARGVPSPYLWSGTNHYGRGKFVADGVYDPNAVSKQPGCAVILEALVRAKLIRFPNL